MLFLDRIKEWMKRIIGKEKKEAIEEGKKESKVESIMDKTHSKESFISDMNNKMAKKNGNKIETPICPGDGTGILHEVKF